MPPRGKLGQDLFLAIDHRDLQSVESLIKRGADPNARNGLEFTPLDIAAASHQPDVMQALLAAGANPEAPSAYGTPLIFAAATGNVKGADLLFTKEVNVNTVRSDGTTALMMASLCGSPEFVGELLKRKVDVNARNISDATALAYAARMGHTEVGRMLLDAGAEVDAADENGRTPLMAAAINGHVDFVKLLISRGAKPNTHDDRRRTALMLAATYGDYPDAVRALVASGADVKATDGKGRSAADLAASHGYRETAALLGKPLTGPLRTRSSREAATAGLKLLQFSMTEFSRNATCISCHQEGLGRMATGSAMKHGLTVDQELRRAQTQRIIGALSAMKPLNENAVKDPEAMKQVPLIEINEVSTISTWLLSGMVAQKDPPTDATAAVAMVLARQQAPDGHWSFSLPRIPMQSSFFTFTALAVQSLKTYMPKSHDKELAERVARARAWLLHSPATTGDDRAFRVLGLKWAGASSREIGDALKDLLAAQQKDGGWAQVPGLRSDAYATGQALYALHVGGGVPTSSPVYKRGAQFLLRTQDDDGSWFVNKRAFPANNYFDAGFPHGESQYASFNGTCWATMALLEMLGK